MARLRDSRSPSPAGSLSARKRKDDDRRDRDRRDGPVDHRRRSRSPIDVSRPFPRLPVSCCSQELQWLTRVIFMQRRYRDRDRDRGRDGRDRDSYRRRDRSIDRRDDDYYRGSRRDGDRRRSRDRGLDRLRSPDRRKDRSRDPDREYRPRRDDSRDRARVRREGTAESSSHRRDDARARDQPKPGSTTVKENEVRFGGPYKQASPFPDRSLTQLHSVAS